MFRNATRRLTVASIALIAVLAVLAPANGQAQSSFDQGDYGSTSGEPFGGLNAQIAPLAGWYGVTTFAAQPGGIEQSPKDGSVYFTEYTSHIVGWTDMDGVLGTYGGLGAGPGQFNTPSEVAIDINDELYVADVVNDRIQVFDNTTNPPTFVREWTGAGYGLGLLDCPNDVEYDNFEVFVLDATNQVKVYDPFGVLLRSWGGTGSGNSQLNVGCQPSYLAVDGTRVYVSDCNNHRVQVFGRGGAYFFTIGQATGVASTADGEFNCPQGIDVDENGLVYVADRNNRVQVFDAAGAFLGTIGAPGTSLGELNTPLGLTVDPSGTVLWVADSGNNRIHVFSNLTCNGLQATHVGTSFSDSFTASTGDDIIALGDGPDEVFASDGDDLVCGGQGNDFIYGGAGIDTIWGEASHDRIWGGPGGDIIRGDAGDDRIWGEDGADQLYGWDGDDVIRGGNDNDEILGEAGEDQLFGGLGDDTMNGGDDPDVMRGGGGIDHMVGGLGRDRIHGDAGADIIDGDGGSDRIYGGTGDDEISAGSGADRVWGGPDNDTMFGNGGQDTMWGQDGNDVLQGNQNSDTLYGGAGDDTLRGSTGKDLLYGGDGDDDMFGGDNTDYLDGGPGVDTADGQLGIDNPLVTDVSGCIAETKVSC